MSILYDEGQSAIGLESRRVLDARMDKARLLGLLEQTGKCDQPFWDTVVEQGWTGIGIAEDHGGLTADVALVWAAAEGQPVLMLAELAGVTRTAVDSFDNSRLYADLAFAGTPATVIAQGPAARALALDVMARVAVVTAHEQMGGAEALMLIARDAVSVGLAPLTWRVFLR